MFLLVLDGVLSYFGRDDFKFRIVEGEFKLASFVQVVEEECNCGNFGVRLVCNSNIVVCKFV